MNHPYLQHDYQAATRIGYTMLVVGAFDLITAILFGFGLFGNAIPPGTGLIAALAILPIGIWAMFMGWHALSTYRAWIARASWLMENTQPQRVHLIPQGIRGALVQPIMSAGNPAYQTVSLSGDARKLLAFPKAESNAEAYRDPHPKGVIVIRTEANAFLCFRTQWHRFLHPPAQP